MPRILIIEDYQSWRKRVKRVLNIKKYKIDEAANLREAREKLEQNNYDLLIVDLTLEEMDAGDLDHYGELVFSISQDGTQPYGRVPTIIITGRNFSKEEIVQALIDFPGWIWGWYEKSKFDSNKFRENVRKAIEAQESYLETHEKVMSEHFNG